VWLLLLHQISHKFFIITIEWNHSRFAAQVVPPIFTRFSIAWAVCVFVVCRIRARINLCALMHLALKLFDIFRCHLAGAHLWGPTTPCVRWRPSFMLPGDGKIWRLVAKTCHYKLQPNCQFYAATWQIQTRIWLDSESAFIQITLILVSWLKFDQNVGFLNSLKSVKWLMVNVLYLIIFCTEDIKICTRGSV